MIKCYALYEEFYAIMKKKEGFFFFIFKISAGIWMLMDEINVAEWFCAKSPSFARCKEGDLPLELFQLDMYEYDF